MKKAPSSALLVVFTGLALVAAACSDDASKLSKSKNGTGGTGDDTSDGGLTKEAAQAAAEAQFRALQADLDRTCGNVCHKAGVSAGSPPTFLADPDPYVSIKAFKGIVTKEPTQSIIWNKTAHSGPAIADTPDLQKKVQNWLTAEAVAVAVEKKPSTDPIAIVEGPNDIDLTPACSAGMTGVHIKFTARKLGGILGLDDVKVSVPAGSDAHLSHLLFVKKLATPKADGSDEVADPTDTFSTLDVQLPNGAETAIASGVLLSGDGFSPYDFASDKVRIQVEKLEPGKVKEQSGPQACKDAAGFATKVLPAMLAGGMQAANGPCSNCHNNGNPTANINLTAQKGGQPDNDAICLTVLLKTNKADFANSIIIKKVNGSGTAHNGGQVANGAAWAKLFTDNMAVFY